MHDTAYEHGRLFFESYWSERFRTIVDLGSQDVNGSLRDYCPDGAFYIGIDMMPAKGVDVVVAPGQALPVASASVDVVVTSSAFEHDVCFWETFLELVRILRPGGLLYVNVPSNDAFHRYPLDCWRFYPDAGVALAKWAARCDVQVELVESFIGLPQAERWADFVAVFRKTGEPKLIRTGRIADRSRAINIYDLGVPAGGPLEAETEIMPDMAIAADLRIRLAAAEARVATYGIDLATREADVVTLEADLAVCQEARAACLSAHKATQAALAAMEEHNATLSADVSAACMQVATLRGILDKSERRNNELEMALADVTRDVEAIRASTSWRMTAGLRRMMIAVRGR